MDCLTLLCLLFVGREKATSNWLGNVGQGERYGDNKYEQV